MAAERKAIDSILVPPRSAIAPALSTTPLRHARNLSMSTGLQSLLLNTAELSQELLFEAGPDGDIRVVNQAWAGLLGWNEVELRETRLHDLVHPDDLEKTRDALMRVSASPAVLAFDARCRGKDGSYRRLSWRVLAHDGALLGAGHEVPATDGPGIDRKVVHDINNLMQNIVGALELVRKLISTGRIAETERFIASAIGAAHRAAEMNQREPSSPAPARDAVERSVEP